MKVTDYLSNHPSVFVFMITAISVLLIAIMIVFVQMRLKSEQKIAKAALEIKKITDSVRAGVVHFLIEEDYKILYASNGFYSLLGYTKEEARKLDKRRIVDFIYVSDIPEFYGLKEMLLCGSAKCEVRMVTKDNQRIWMLMDAQLVNKREDKNTVSAVFMDISEQKTMQRMLQIEGERYRIASELSNDILFEYDLKNDEMKYSDKYKDIFGKELHSSHYSQSYEKHTEIIPSTDLEEYAEFVRKLRSGEQTIEAQFRLQRVDGSYVWCDVMGKTVYDVNHEAVKVIGKIVNVDAYKRELEYLEVKATRDPLTGVYNKSITGKKINDIIQSNQEASHLFMILDIDDFKKVNDNYGHIQGDKILIYVTQNIKRVFNKSEVIGRIGGDEFVVFVGNVLNKADIMVKVETLMKILTQPFKEADLIIPISASIGAATYPLDGKNYEELYAAADKALYVVKKNGKHGFTLSTQEENR